MPPVVLLPPRNKKWSALQLPSVNPRSGTQQKLLLLLLLLLHACKTNVVPLLPHVRRRSVRLQTLQMLRQPNEKQLLLRSRVRLLQFVQQTKSGNALRLIRQLRTVQQRKKNCAPQCNAKPIAPLLLLLPPPKPKVIGLQPWLLLLLRSKKLAV